MIIHCVCINDNNRPEIIPLDKWIIKGRLYNITHVLKQQIAYKKYGLGVIIQGINLTTIPGCYMQTFRMKRFAISQKDLDKVEAMFELYNKIEDFKTNIQTLFEQEVVIFD